MELWIGIGAMLAINVIGWLLSYFRGSRQEAKEAARESKEVARELAVLSVKVEGLSDRIDDGLTEDIKCLDRRLRNIEVKIGAGGNR